MVTLRQLEHPGLAAYTCGAVKAALRHIVGVQFRNGATLGGSMYSRFGFSDVLTLFLAMDAPWSCTRAASCPCRRVCVHMPYDRDILVRLIVKKRPAPFATSRCATVRPTFPCSPAQQPSWAEELSHRHRCPPGCGVLMR